MDGSVVVEEEEEEEEVEEEEEQEVEAEAQGSVHHCGRRPDLPLQRGYTPISTLEVCPEGMGRAAASSFAIQGVRVCICHVQRGRAAPPCGDLGVALRSHRGSSQLLYCTCA